MNLNFRRLAAGLDLAGSLLLLVCLTGTMTIHPLTRTVFAVIHLLGVGAGILLIIGLAGLQFGPDGVPGIVGWTGYIITTAGFLLFVAGNFMYAFFHSLLNLVSVNDSLHQLPLSWARYSLCLGSVLYAVSILLKKTGPWRGAALLLMVGSVVYLVGWHFYGDSFFRQRSLSRHFVAGSIVVAFCLAWFWLGINNWRSEKKRFVP